MRLRGFLTARRTQRHACDLQLGRWIFLYNSGWDVYVVWKEEDGGRGGDEGSCDGNEDAE